MISEVGEKNCKFATLIKHRKLAKYFIAKCAELTSNFALNARKILRWGFLTDFSIIRITNNSYSLTRIVLSYWKTKK